MSRREVESILHGRERENRDYGRIEVFKEIEFDAAKGSVFSLQYSHDGKVLAAGYSNGAIDLFHAETGELKRVVRKSRHGGLQIMCLRFHPKRNEILLASTADGKIYYIDTSLEQPSEMEFATEKGNEINCLDFDQYGEKFATGGKDLGVRIYNFKEEKLENYYPGYSVKKESAKASSGASFRVFALKYHPENYDVFLTGGWDDQIKIWDARVSDDPVKRTIYGPHVCGDGLDLKGYKVLTASWRNHNALQIWNYSEDYGPSSKKKATEIEFVHDENKGQYLYCAEFLNDHIVMAGGSGTNSCEAINTDTNEVIGEVKFDSPVISLDTAMSEAGHQFAIGSQGRKLVLGRFV